MRSDYKFAKKMGDEAVRAAVKNGMSPYLPVLDTFEEVKHSLGEVRLGLMELPISRIKGNKEMGRNNAFANNFMPIFPETSEFATKWARLYDSYMEEGIRDAIECYEYMNQYYVLEGNKRVSVSKYGGGEYILANVIRILPAKNDTKEVKVYYEYLDFYAVTKNYYIILNEPGGYAKLAELLGQNLTDPWDEQLCADMKVAYSKFGKLARTILDLSSDFTLGDAFLVYISIFPMKTLFEESDEQIIKNIRLAKKELLADRGVDSIAFLEEAPEAAKQKSSLFIPNLFSSKKEYTEASPLRAGFIFDAGVDESRWIESHELGRLYADEMTGASAVTKRYISANRNGNIEDALASAIADKNEIIFTVSPKMMPDTLKAAVLNPSVKFLNCSVGQAHSAVRCYHGKLYEAAFLMGILCADTMLLDRNTSGERKIGYIARAGASMSVLNLNAFAIGVSLIDPECRIELRYLGEGDHTDWRSEWADKGIPIYADFDYSTLPGIENKPGVYRIDGDKDIHLGTPYFSWGRYYVQIVQSVMSGAWDIGSLVSSNTAANYWFGLSTGVVNIVTPVLPYQTQKMLSFFKNSIVRGGYDPFTGELHMQGEIVSEERSTQRNKISASLEKLKDGQIVAMDWLNDNIDGTMPLGEEII